MSFPKTKTDLAFHGLLYSFAGPSTPNTGSLKERLLLWQASRRPKHFHSRDPINEAVENQGCKKNEPESKQQTE